MSIILALAALGILILVHELGHFTAAKLSGVYVEKFSIGFGPKIAQFKRNGTEYMISAIPLGGYVKLHRMFEEEEEVAGKTAQSFYNKPVYKKIFIITAGVAANVVFAFILFLSIYFIGVKTYSPVVGDVTYGKAAAKAGFATKDLIMLVDGRKVDTWMDFLNLTGDIKKRTKPFLVEVDRGGARLILNYLPELLDEGELAQSIPDFGMTVFADPVVGSVSGGLPAFDAGMKSGDRIVSINNIEVTQWADVSKLIQNSEGGITVKALRKGMELNFNIQPELVSDSYGERRVIGIMPVAGNITVRKSIGTSFIEAGQQTIEAIGLMYKGLGQMISGKASRNDIGGPIMIVQETSKFAQKGIDSYIFFVAIISLNLAVLNILPLPVLDGGYVVMFVYEAISKKRVSIKAREYSQKAGVILLGALMVFVIFNDILRLLK